eukprot:3200580-Amphidinium_carterae.2
MPAFRQMLAIVASGLAQLPPWALAVQGTASGLPLCKRRASMQKRVRRTCVDLRWLGLKGSLGHPCRLVRVVAARLLRLGGDYLQHAKDTRPTRTCFCAKQIQHH